MGIEEGGGPLRSHAKKKIKNPHKKAEKGRKVTTGQEGEHIYGSPRSKAEKAGAEIPETPSTHTK